MKRRLFIGDRKSPVAEAAANSISAYSPSVMKLAAAMMISEAVQRNFFICGMVLPMRYSAAEACTAIE